MSQLLVIFNRDAEDDVCRLFLPFWRRSGCDLLFSSPLDAPSKLDGVKHVQFGRKITDSAKDYWFYQSRVLDTFRYCLSLDYTGFIFTQYDSICLGKLPDIGPNDSIHRLACGPLPRQFESRIGMHPPWCFGKNRLMEFVVAASKEPIRIEHGIMDRWLPCVMQRHWLQYSSCEWAWSANSIDTLAFVLCARQAIANGCLFVHGVKNQDQLDAILQENNS